MNIHDIGKAGNVDRSGDRTTKAGARRDVLVPQAPRDEAKISASSREAAATVDALTERARREDGGREELVARALAKLRSGELDGEPVVAATARKLLAAKFQGG